MFHNFLLDFVVVMNFRKHGNISAVKNVLNLFHKLPHLRLNKKARSSQLLRSKSKSIQTYHGSSVVNQAYQSLLDEFPCCPGIHVKIHLLLVKGTPDLFGGSVCKGHIDAGRMRLSFIKHCNVFGRGFAVRPEILES
jgi:hypothetical protein